MSNNNKICVVTGASSGIGLQISLQLARQQAIVIVLARNQAIAGQTASYITRQTGNKNIAPYGTDLAIQHDIKQIGQKLNTDWPQIDVLIHNAGFVTSELTLTPDGIEKQLAVNHVAPFLLSHYLLPALKKSGEGRIICVNSRAHGRGTMHFNDLFLHKSYHISKAYNQSKLANMLFTYRLAAMNTGTGITVNAFHPGLVNTNFGIKGVSPFAKYVWMAISKFGRRAETAAEDGVYLALSNQVKGISGKYFHNKHEVKSSANSYNLQWQQKLWDITLNWTKLKAHEYGTVS